MEWRDTGILLFARKHGETALILDVFTAEHGRQNGVLRGGASRKLAPHMQPGAQLDLAWRARLDDHIGAFSAEPVRSRAAAAMSNRQALSGLNAVTALLAFSLPERESQPGLYRQSEQLLDLLDQQDIWPLAYLRWELALLETLGFGLDLSACAVTGATEGLHFVSPRSGRAVSAKGAGEWAAKLLPLPPVMLGLGDAPDAQIAEALKTTGYFLETGLATQLQGKPLPQARAAFVDVFNRRVSQ